MKQTLIISVVGTSILNNAARASQQSSSLMRDHANQPTRAAVPSADAAALDALLARAEEVLAGASQDQARGSSAELNTLLQLIADDPTAVRHHVLISTDTWLGHRCAEMVQAWLQRDGTVELRRVADLRATTLEEMQLAFADIVRWCDETIPGYRAAGYRIIFNLTGGFKAVQGFMQTLAYFYADETVYTFESEKLMRIPRLPVRITVDDTVRENLQTFRRMALGLPIESAAAAGIAEPLQMVIGSERSLSSWGELAWSQARPALYGERLWPSPSARIVFGKQFVASTSDVSAQRLQNLNERIDGLAFTLETNKPIRKVDLKQLGGKPVPGSTHEFDAWTDGDARRVFCHYEGNVLVLDKLGKALH